MNHPPTLRPGLTGWLAWLSPPRPRQHPSGIVPAISGWPSGSPGAPRITTSTSGPSPNWPAFRPAPRCRSRTSTQPNLPLHSPASTACSGRSPPPSVLRSTDRIPADGLGHRPDGLGLSARVRLPAGAVDNTGRLLADAGSVALQARVVNQSGLVQANSVRERNGVIELYASKSIALAFARAMGEYGSVVFISGNLPMKTEITPLLIMTKLEQYDYEGAASLAVVVLVVSFLLLLTINLLQRWSGRFQRPD